MSTMMAMGMAPKNEPILAWCDHEAAYSDDAGVKPTLYAAHADASSHAPTGFHIVEWGGGWWDSWEDGGASMPDWWFVADSEFQVAANPIGWLRLEKPETIVNPAEDGRSVLVAGEGDDLQEAVVRGDGRGVVTDLLGDEYGGPDYPRQMVALRIVEALKQTWKLDNVR